jgi:hypothetical protein
VLARVSVGALLSASVIVIGVAIAASFGVTWPGGKDQTSSPQINSVPDEAIAMPNLEPRDVHRADRKKKKAEHRRTVLMASDVKVLAPQGLVLSKPPVVPSTPVDEPVTLAPKPKPTPQRSPANPSPAKPPVAPAPSTALPAAPAGQAAAARATNLVRLSVRSVAVAPNAESKPELLVKMGIDGAHPDDAVPDTVTMHLQPAVPETVPKDDPTLALTARLDMVEAPRSSPTDPALRMRVRMAITPAETGTPMVQEPGAGDGKSNVIALTVPLASFAGAPTDGTPPEEPEQPGGPGPDPVPPVDPAPEQPGSGGPGSDPGPVDPAPQPTPVDPAPQPTPVDPAPQPTPVDPAPQPTPVDPVPGGPTAGTPTTAPISPIEILIPIGPLRPNAGTTTVPITPGTGDNAPVAAPIPIDIVLEELPPDGPPPDSIPVDIVLEELPPYDPPADPAAVPTPAAQEPPVDVPAPPADPGAGPAPDAGDPALTASAGDATSHDSGT